MKLKTKLPLMCTTVLFFLLAAALYGIYRLNGSITTYNTTIQGNHGNERAVAEMLVDFKTQVQEWKDVLLRGKDPQKLAKHWTAFETQERAVADKVKALQAALPEGESKAWLSPSQPVI